MSTYCTYSKASCRNTIEGTCYECERKVKEFTSKCDKSIELMAILGIKYNSYDLGIHINDLYDLLMDDEKMKVLNSKLNNKVFW